MSDAVTRKAKRACRRGEHNWRHEPYKIETSLPDYAGDMYLSICQNCDVIKCRSVAMSSTKENWHE